MFILSAQAALWNWALVLPSIVIIEGAIMVQLVSVDVVGQNAKLDTVCLQLVSFQKALKLCMVGKIVKFHGTTMCKITFGWS